MRVQLAERRIVLQNFSLSIPNLDLTPGVYHLQGANGAGKTTFFRYTLDLMGDPNNLTEKDFVPESRGYVPQAFREPLLPWWAVGKNVCLFRNSAAMALELLNEFGFAGSDLAKRPQSLSGGQSQRVILARELALQTDVLFLDEPFSALDRASAGAVMAALYRMRASALTIISTHIPLTDILPNAHFKRLRIDRTSDWEAVLCED